VTTLGDNTAADLADALDALDVGSRAVKGTGWLSMLDEATLAFGSKYPEVAAPQREFGRARYAHLRSYSPETGGYADEEWRCAIDAAHSLAAALRPLGDTRIARCERQAGWGTCDLPLDDDGQCRSTLGHTDGDPS
jgi:hypothetical protein